jgi:hypothetical protein
MRESLNNDQGVTLDVAVSVVESVGEDAVPAAVVQSFADANRISPQEAAARIESVKAGYTMDAARQAEEATGIPAAIAARALYESRHSDGIKELAYRHLHEGKADWGPVVQTWLASWADTAEGRQALYEENAATGRVRIAGDTLLIRLDTGHEVDWATAVYTKQLKFGR